MIQRSWNEHVQRAPSRIDARKARHDAKVASPPNRVPAGVSPLCHRVPSGAHKNNVPSL